MIYRNKLIDVIRQVEGVVDFVPSVMTATTTLNGTVAINPSYETYSGYFNYDQSNPSTIFTFTPLS